MTQAFNLSQLANKVNSSGELDLATGVTGTLPVNEGGTGQTTYTDGQLLIGNTTGNTLTKATLTQGTGISVTNGAGSITIANTLSSGFTNMQVFTSPGTFTTPATTTRVKITVVGGGGNGGAGSGTGSGSGGGGGGTAVYVGPINSSTPYPVTVGAGGVSPAGPGGTSSFGSLASATGGGGVPGPGAGGAGSTGTLLLEGGNGTSGPISGQGGNSSISGIGVRSQVGKTYGGGGGGGGINQPGNAGAVGVVIVEW